jgi:thioredoxin-dependent peroxiredoxin
MRDIQRGALPIADAGPAVIATYDAGARHRTVRAGGNRRGDSLRRMLEQGTQAPDFDLPDQDGDNVKLSDLKGQTVVLYFYPKADTPGCTTQACGIRDHLPDYTEAGVRVLGVSPDPVTLVKKFHDKQALNFTLLADEDHAVCEAYGVWAEKSMYGKTYWGAQRATFIIDPEGKVADVIPKVSPKTHDEQVLKILGDL